MLIKAEFFVESENYNQNILLYKVCLLDRLKEQYPNRKNSKFSNRKIQGKIFFLMEAEFTIEAEHYNQNMSKSLVFLQYVKDRDRLKSHSFFLPLDFIDL